MLWKEPMRYSEKQGYFKKKAASRIRGKTAGQGMKTILFRREEK